MDSNYTLKFLPLFENDLNAIVDYISINLQNPTAANKLIDDVEKAIFDRLSDPEAFEPYPTAAKHPLPYYYIRVRNYLVFYVVYQNTMEVRRMIYGPRDISKLL